ncbi:MAG: MlaD family protein [Cyanobacteriota bacterium]|nr:MlaD family protein [Cyanobacteriota bacterium]
MRRSVREALVGLSLLAALAGAAGLWLWLKGISLSRRNWTIQASFTDAAGLAERSSVTFRGVVVGSVRRIRVTDQAVVAELEITDPQLRLARPVVARVAAGSLLGGDAVVALLSGGRALPAGLPAPAAKSCPRQRMVCNGDRVRGVTSPTLDTVTATVQKLLDQADRQGLVDKMVAATVSFDATAKETEKLTREGQLFLSDAQVLLRQLNGSVGKVDPILSNLNTASADAVHATRDVRRLTAALGNPRTLADLRTTLANARQLTARWEAVGGDVQKLSGDPRFLDGLRSVSVGLGRFFDELYPGAAGPARPRATTAPGATGPGSAAARSSAGSPPAAAAGAQSSSPPTGVAGRLSDLFALPAPPRRGRPLSAADRNEQQRGPQLPPSGQR